MADAAPLSTPPGPCPDGAGAKTITSVGGSPGELAPPSLRTVALRVVDSIVRSVHPTKHDPFGPSRLTHERAFLETAGRLPGCQVGITISELHQLRSQKGIEIIQVVSNNGNSNIESVLWRHALASKQRIELQGPALNTRADGGLPLDVRLFGIGLTGDAVDLKAKEAVSYTAEVKVHVSDLVMLGGPGAAAKAAQILSAGTSGEVASVVAATCAAAVPVVGGLIALSSARWAHKILGSRRSSTATKVLAVAHAISDGVRIFAPLIGTIGNAALVGIALWNQRRGHTLAPATDMERRTPDTASSPPTLAPPRQTAA